MGKDLWKGRLSKSDSQRLQQIVGEVPKGQLSEPAPWRVWKTNSSGQTRYIILLGESLTIIPGGSSACVQLFDAVAKKINNWCFFAGWRSVLESGAIEYSSHLGTDSIVLHVAKVINGRRVAKEYFSLSNDRLKFVRMEDEQGNAVQNEYIFPNYEIGVIPVATTVDEWASMLESSDRAEVLSALTFLGGRHLREPQRHFVPGTTGEQVRGAISGVDWQPAYTRADYCLTKSEDAWVRQAAVLAARGPRERLLQ